MFFSTYTINSHQNPPSMYVFEPWRLWSTSKELAETWGAECSGLALIAYTAHIRGSTRWAEPNPTIIWSHLEPVVPLWNHPLFSLGPLVGVSLPVHVGCLNHDGGLTTMVHTPSIPDDLTIIELVRSWKCSQSQRDNIFYLGLTNEEPDASM